MNFHLPAQTVSTEVPELIEDYTTDAPAWLLRRLGRIAREERKLSDAFLLLNRSLESDPENPETLTELALSYFASGDLHQSRAYLNRALENRSRLSSPDMEYYILYQFAEIYSQSDTYEREYENILRDLINADEQFSSTDITDVSLRKNIRAILNKPAPSGVSSLDQTIILYRIADSFSLEAHLRLGRFYVHSGRYDEAQQHLIFAVLKMYTKLISSLRDINILYSFTDSEDLFNRIRNNETFLSYLKTSGFDEALYYLGSASYGFNPNRQYVYSGIWQTLQYLPYQSAYISRASLQLRDPQKEDILYGSEQFRESVNE
ncbi:MAG: tetratricopeptide repeat protein [Salinispira sp.]